MPLRILCRISGHSVNRRRVWFDGLNFRTRCRRCGVPMVRDAHSWQVANEADTGEMQHGTHPN